MRAHQQGAQLRGVSSMPDRPNKRLVQSGLRVRMEPLHDFVTSPEAAGYVKPGESDEVALKGPTHTLLLKVIGNLDGLTPPGMTERQLPLPFDGPTSAATQHAGTAPSAPPTPAEPEEVELKPSHYRVLDAAAQQPKTGRVLLKDAGFIVPRKGPNSKQRQLLCDLVRCGLLERIKKNWYRLPPPPLAPRPITS